MTKLKIILSQEVIKKKLGDQVLLKNSSLEPNNTNERTFKPKN